MGSKFKLLSRTNPIWDVCISLNDGDASQKKPDGEVW